jgi:hypothetical protein
MDVAYSFAPLDSAATVRTIRIWPRVIAASPNYLEVASMPTVRRSAI